MPFCMLEVVEGVLCVDNGSLGAFVDFAAATEPSADFCLRLLSYS